MSQDVQRKITVLHLLCVLPALQQRYLWFTLYLQKPWRVKMTILKCLMTLVMCLRDCHFLTHSLPKKMATFKVWSCSELKANLTYFKVCITAVGLLALSSERGADNAKVVSSTLTRMTTIDYV